MAKKNSPHHLYTKEELTWLKENKDGKQAEELKTLFNERFKTNVSKDSIYQTCKRYGFPLGRPQRIWTEQEDNLLRKLHGKMSQREIVEEFNEMFPDKPVTLSALSHRTQRIGLLLDDPTVFNRKNGTFNGSQSLKPVGTEKMFSNGYVYVKVNDKAGTSGDHIDRQNWRPKGQVMWEKYHDMELPKGWRVIFLNNDKMDFSKDNLAAIPNRYMTTLLGNGWRKGEPLITKTAIEYCKLRQAIKERMI